MYVYRYALLPLKSGHQSTRPRSRYIRAVQECFSQGRWTLGRPLQQRTYKIFQFRLTVYQRVGETPRTEGARRFERTRE